MANNGVHNDTSMILLDHRNAVNNTHKADKHDMSIKRISGINT